MLRQAIYISLMLICSPVLLQPNPLIARVVEQVLVVIDGDPYTLSNVKEFTATKLRRKFPVGDLNSIGKEDKEALEGFITDKLLAAEVKQVGIKVSEDDVNISIDRIRQRNGVSREKFRAALEQQGMTMETYRGLIRGQIEKGRMINLQVRKKVNVTSEDVERYYRLNKSKFMTERRVRLRHILFPLPEEASPEQEKEVVRKLKKIRERIAHGEDFAKMARTYSEGSGASEGGEIGWVSRGGLLKEIEEVAFNRLSVGEVSQPIRTSLGVHIIKLDERSGGTVLPLSAVSGKVKKQLYAKALDERFERWLRTDLRKKHRVDVKLPGVIFRPEETKEGTLKTLMASASRNKKKEDPGVLSYLNPLYYITKETPIEGEDAEGDLSGDKVVSVFGIPLYISEGSDQEPEDPFGPPEEADKPAEEPAESDGFFSSVLGSLNPF